MIRVMNFMQNDFVHMHIKSRTFQIFLTSNFFFFENIGSCLTLGNSDDMGTIYRPDLSKGSLRSMGQIS